MWDGTEGEESSMTANFQTKQPEEYNCDLPQ